jgi:hypothetical protein
MEDIVYKLKHKTIDLMHKRAIKAFVRVVRKYQKDWKLQKDYGEYLAVLKQPAGPDYSAKIARIKVELMLEGMPEEERLAWRLFFQQTVKIKPCHYPNWPGA